MISSLLKSYTEVLPISLQHCLDFQADLKERYSVNELLADLAGCRATRVLIFVDQSYSGVLSKRLRGSQKHLNVVLIQGQTWQTLNHQRLKPDWEDSHWSNIKPTTCLLDYLGKVTPLFVCFALLNKLLTSSSANDAIRVQGCSISWSHGPVF